MTTHYGNSMTPTELFPWAKKIARNIVKRLILDEKAEDVVPILVYRGMSGTAHATAIMSGIPAKYQDRVGMVYVRKEDEKSHGNPIERTDHLRYSVKKPIFIFCDDFVSEGGTLIAVLSALMDFTRKEIKPSDIFYALSAYSFAKNVSSINGNALMKIDAVMNPTFHSKGRQAEEFITNQCATFYTDKKAEWDRQAEENRKASEAFLKSLGGVVR